MLFFSAPVIQCMTIYSACGRSLSIYIYINSHILYNSNSCIEIEIEIYIYVLSNTSHPFEKKQNLI